MNKNTMLMIGIVIIIVIGALLVLRPGDSGVNIPTQEKREAPTVVEISVEQAANALVGVWQSVDDSQSLREFTKGGVVIESYEGRILEEDEGTNTWVLFTPKGADNAGFPNTLDRSAVYLAIETMEGASYFIVSTYTSEKLSLIHLARGNTLEYNRYAE